MIAEEATRESPLWAESLRPPDRREEQAVFSPFAHPRFAAGIETIYEGYLAHYGRPRLFDPPDPDAALLLGDYLYAHGLVRIAALGDVEAVRLLAELIAYCAHLRSEGAEGDGEAWVAAVRRLGDDETTEDAVERALDSHVERVG